MKKRELAARFKQALIQNHALAENLTAPAFPVSAYDDLTHWQRERLRATYADLRKQRRYREATRFFLVELYGGRDFQERDQAVHKVYPIMVRMLSDKMLMSITKAFELQAISIQFDQAMTRLWAEEKNEGKVLDESFYADLYQRTGRFEERHKQLDLIIDLGRSLGDIVDRPLVMRLIRLLRGPARAAGFGRLQDFLEGGLNAFRLMGDPTEFLATVEQRERTAIRRLESGELTIFQET